MRKMITTVALVLALASPAFANSSGKTFNFGGTSSTRSAGATSTVGHQRGNALGVAGSSVGGSASALVNGAGAAGKDGAAGINGPVTGGGSVLGELSAGSSSISSAGGVVVGNGKVSNSTRGASSSGATIGLTIQTQNLRGW